MQVRGLHLNLRLQSAERESPKSGTRGLTAACPVQHAGDRWIGTVRRELLDRTIIWNQHQLQRLVIDHIDHYNIRRPHRSLDQRPPAPHRPPSANGQLLRIVRATRCGGLVNEYRKAA